MPDDAAPAVRTLRRQLVDGALEAVEHVRAAADAALPEPDQAWRRGIVADTQTGTTRVGATVIGVWLPVEETHRVLGGAIDAAAG